MGRQETFPLGGLADLGALREESACHEPPFGCQQGRTTSCTVEQGVNEGSGGGRDASLTGDPAQIQTLQGVIPKRGRDRLRKELRRGGLAGGTGSAEPRRLARAEGGVPRPTRREGRVCGQSRRRSLEHGFSGQHGQ